VEDGKVCFLIRFFIYQLFQFSTNTDFLCAPHFSREGWGRVRFQTGKRYFIGLKKAGKANSIQGLLNAVSFFSKLTPAPLLGREGRERWKKERFVF